MTYLFLIYFVKVTRALTGRHPVRPAADDNFEINMKIVAIILFQV